MDKLDAGVEYGKEVKHLWSGNGMGKRMLQLSRRYLVDQLHGRSTQEPEIFKSDGEMLAANVEENRRNFAIVCPHGRRIQQRAQSRTMLLNDVTKERSLVMRPNGFEIKLKHL